MSKTSYILGKRINRGGMAEIFLGKAIGEDDFERICAIKRILPHYAQDKEYIKMFRDEAHICKRLQHTNIVQVYDFSEVEDSYALIMEYVDGADLRTLLNTCENLKVKLPLPMAIFIVACAARGLHYAHTKTDDISGKPLEIIHRDISPQNILISYDGDVKVTDFGIASATAENKITETKAGVVKGKYSYMSPEQVMAKKLDARSDIFSLAIVLWEALSMRRLFAGANEVETIKKVQECQIPARITDLNPEVDEILAAIVQRGLEPDRRRRYQTAAAFENELSKYLHVRYPDFGASDLGDFLKQKLATRRMESSDHIKQTLAITTTMSKIGRQKDMDSKEIKLPAVAGEATHSKLALNMPSIDKSGISNNMGAGPESHFRLQKSRMTIPGGHQSPRTYSPDRSRIPLRLGDSRLSIPQRAPLKKGSRLLIRTFIIMVILAVAGVYYLKKKGPVEKVFTAQIRTVPNVVQLVIDGKPVRKNSFLKTPLTLKFNSGKHTVVVNRPGYLPHTYEFKGKPGDKQSTQPVYLKRKPSTNLMSVKIKSVPATGASINVDNGFFNGKAPTIVNDLTMGAPHTISFSGSEQATMKENLCVFKTPAEKTTSKILTVTIFVQGPNHGECKAEYE
jgi:serine/threonine-protein kinase